MKLNSLIKTHNVNALGFEAFRGISAISEHKGPKVCISTLSPAVMLSMGHSTYYAPVLSRGAVYSTTDDVYHADLDIERVSVFTAPEITACESRIIIVSRHQGTIDILKDLYPDAEILTGNVTPDDIKGYNVVGTLPPALIQHCHRYKAVTIKDFDHTKDGDLSGDELKERLVLADTITVTVERD